MPNNFLVPASFGGLIASRDEKALAKQFRSLQAAGNLELAEVRRVEAVEVAKIEAVEVAGHVGIAATGSLNADRRFEIERDPISAGGVNHVYESTARAIGSRIEAMNRRLG
jgi:hypothetical protein